MGKKDKSPKAEPVEETTKAKKSGKPGKDEKSAKAEKKSKETTASTVDDDELDDPGSGDNWKITEALGELLLIEPLSIEPEMKTDYGPAQPIKANVAVLNEKKVQKTEAHHGVLIFQGVLIGSLRDKIGKKVVGRLVQGDAKPGKSAPYILELADEDEKDVAKAWLKAR